MSKNTEKTFDFSVNKKENKSKEKNTIQITIALMTAIAALIGLHNHVEYAGWVLFLAFCML